MRQKLGLAASLVHRPRLLLLDEPTGGVDPVTRQDFWQLIIRLVRQDGVGVLVSTPYMDEAVRCTYVGMMVSGRLVLEGPPSALVDSLAGQILEVHAAPLNRWRQIAAALPEVIDAQTLGTRLHLRVAPGSARRVSRVLKQAGKREGLVLDSIEAADPMLDDVFNAVLADHASADGLYEVNEVNHA
jgi:ABC-2 type transport system ATP-binding protein